MYSLTLAKPHPHISRELRNAYGMASQTQGELTASQRQQWQVTGSHLGGGDGESSSEGTLKLTVPNLSQLEGAILSRPLKIQNLPCTDCFHQAESKWYGAVTIKHLVVAPRESISSSQDGRVKTLGVFVHCVPDQSVVGQGWSVTARARISLLNHTDLGRSSRKEFTHTYSAQQNDWGYSSFIKWKNLMDPSKGFVKDDSIVVEAHINAETPSFTPPPSLPPPRTLQDTPSLLCCPVCYEDYQTAGIKRPATLKCGHTFCQECVQKGCVKVEGRVQLKCSLCTQEHSASSEGKMWFPNYSLTQVIGNVVPKSKDFCNTHQHDQKYYCFDDHSLVIGNVVPKSKDFCNTHQHDQKYYCFDDHSLVCIYCVYHGEHSGHRCKHIDDARAEVEESVTAAKLQASRSVVEMERGLCMLQDEVKGLKSQEQNVTQLVESFFSNIEAAILRQKECLLQQLRTHTEELGSSLEARIRDLEGRRSEANKILAEYHSWQSLPPGEALGGSNSLQSKLRALSASATRNVLSAGSTAKISFELPYSDVIASIGLLGRLNISPSQDSRDQEFESKQKTESSGINIAGASPSSSISSPSAPSHSQTVEGLDQDEFEVESPAKRRRK